MSIAFTAAQDIRTEFATRQASLREALATPNRSTFFAARIDAARNRAA